MFSATCRSAGLQVIECTAQERSFSFQNINIVKSKSTLTFFKRNQILDWTINSVCYYLYLFFYQWWKHSIFQFQLSVCHEDAVAAVNPFLRRVPPWLRESYLLDCLMELQKLKAPSTDGCTVACYRLMIAHVRKS